MVEDAPALADLIVQFQARSQTYSKPEHANCHVCRVISWPSISRRKMSKLSFMFML